MNVPGFTAESSLYQTSGRYRTASGTHPAAEASLYKTSKFYRGGGRGPPGGAGPAVVAQLDFSEECYAKYVSVHCRLRL